MIVNKYNALTSEFIPELKTLNTKYGSGQLEPKTYDAFMSTLSILIYHIIQNSTTIHDKKVSFICRK